MPVQYVYTLRLSTSKQLTKEVQSNDLLQATRCSLGRIKKSPDRAHHACSIASCAPPQHLNFTTYVHTQRVLLPPDASKGAYATLTCAQRCQGNDSTALVKPQVVSSQLNTVRVNTVNATLLKH
jgi:hypothetical protein